MQRYILGRILALVLIALGVAVLVFLLLRVIPGDAAANILGLEGDTEKIEVLRHQLGLDRPLLVQFGDWLLDLLRGDLGRSLQTDRPVLDEVLRRLPITIYLAVGALTIAAVLGIPLGVVSAIYRNSFTDVLLRIGAMVGLAMPSFWFAILLILTFSLRWPLFPPSDYVSPIEPLRSLHHLALPAISLGLPVGAVIMRMTRSSVLEVLRADYVRTARAKGLNEWMVVRRHVLRNAMINVLTIVGLQMGRLLGGSIVIETIFGWPGLGHMAYRAISLRDYPVAQGVVLFTALLYSVVTLMVDVLYTYVDPRVRYG